MDASRLEAKFLKQARRGVAIWRLRFRIAVASALLLAGAAAYSLWSAWQSDDPAAGLLNVLLWLGLAAAASTWAIHAELMQGAAVYVARSEAPPP